MKLSEVERGTQTFTQLGTYVIAVLSVRIEGSWCVYVGAVNGYDHNEEWRGVMSMGDKQIEPIARAIVENLFTPGFEVDLPYAP